MRPLSASDVIQIWEWGQGRSPLQQALVMLAVAYPDHSPEQLAALPIGQRDAHLLMLRSHTFGANMQAVATCPHCTEALEFGLTVNDICVAPPLPVLQATEPERYEWQQGDYRLSVRLPTSADLLAIASLPLDDAPAQLLQRCIDHAACGETEIAVTDLPEAIAIQVVQSIAQHDPQAEVVLNLTCPVCTHQWAQLFDIISFFWRELAAKAQRLLQEVHVLASVYGWHEADILSMSALRRQTYLAQIGGGA
jgi:T4 bacteriophage base plate protein